MRKKMTRMLCLTILLAAILAVNGCGANDSSAETETTQAAATAEETESTEAETTEEETETSEAATTVAETESTEAETTVAETTVAETETTEVEATVEETESTEALQDTEDALNAEAADASTEVQFGTNQNDAVLVPLNTKIYGTMSSGYYWCSFTTGSNTEADYRITLIDKSADSHSIIAKVYDEYGTQLGSGEAYASGLAVTFSPENLEPNTTYYVQFSLWRELETEFMMIVRDCNEVAAGIKTSDSITTEATSTIVIATNMDDAQSIPIGSKVGASLDSGYHYYAFTADVTGEYTFTVVDVTADSHSAIATVYDEYGTKLGSGEAYADGTAVTFSAGELTAGTTYYICLSLWRELTTGYTITINEPEDAEVQTATIEEEDEEEDLIFSTPFEINSTTVQFVINSDEFIDEEAAKEAVEPVAEALLAYPDHSILIAGTTATDGTQESCVKLSERRAAAVKNLLVEEFGVPESQIETIGLGYEADPFERGQDREIEGDITSKFIESEAKKNRRVVIMDIDSEIAQEILAANE